MLTHLNQLVAVATVLLCILSVNSGSAFAQQPPTGEAKYKTLYRIEVEDADEAALLEQQLRLKPELMRGRWFYYYGDEGINRRLRAFGYRPTVQDPDDVFSRVVKVKRKGDDDQLQNIGVTVVLREREHWVVRGTLRQLRLLSKLGYSVSDLGKDELRPRQIQVTVSSLQEVSEVVAPRIDIYTVQPTRSGYIVLGAAFDKAIDELKALGLKVENIPKP